MQPRVVASHGVTFSPEQLERVLAAVKDRVPNTGKCQICGSDDWQIQDGMAQVTMHPIPFPAPTAFPTSRWTIPSPFLPSVVLICTTCGQTVFLNALVLGLGDLLGPPPPAAEWSPEHPEASAGEA